MSRGRRRKRKASKVVITYADGSQRVAKPGEFRKPVRKRAKYDHYLRSSHWKRTRKATLKRDGHRCKVCGCEERLQVHHLTYERVGHEDADDLITLCSVCHTKEHMWLTREERALR